MVLALPESEIRVLMPALPRAVRAIAGAALWFRRIDEVCEEVAEELDVGSPWDDPQVRALTARRDRCLERLIALNRELVDLALAGGARREELLPPAPDLSGLVAARAEAAGSEERIDRVEAWASGHLEVVAYELEGALGELRERLARCRSRDAVALTELVVASQAACRIGV